MNIIYILFKYGNISPGSSLGSVIGYPSITVPMGVIGEFSYGLEFLSGAYSESLLYNVAFEFEKANKNIVTTSSLTPSLYEVPQEVETLKVLYEEIIAVGSDVGKVTEWLNEVKSFFKDYNMNDNVVNVAKELIQKYESLNIKNEISVDNFTGNREKFVEYLVVAIIIIFVFIIIKEFSKCFR